MRNDDDTSDAESDTLRKRLAVGKMQLMSMPIQEEVINCIRPLGLP